MLHFDLSSTHQFSFLVSASTSTGAYRYALSLWILIILGVYIIHREKVNFLSLYCLGGRIDTLLGERCPANDSRRACYLSAIFGTTHPHLPVLILWPLFFQFAGAWSHQLPSAYQHWDIYCIAGGALCASLGVMPHGRVSTVSFSQKTQLCSS